MIAIVDYDAGNIKSVEKALQFLGEEPKVTREKEVLLQADKVIVPGVGAFGDAMSKMHQYGLVEILREIAKKGTPILGICLGLQLFFESSEESPGVEGLGLLPGKIVRIPDKEGVKIPHMGWNSIGINSSSRLLKGIEEGAYVYFVHSYYLQAAREADVAATTDYVVNIHAAAEHENIFATQFHPEKSGDIGLQILKNFIEL
ncbi:MAG: imidazole glycerol phosphate synthase subunit HisH [Clostridiales bacterium]|nr:imidazole glycerol phosphate synthase subunit HisH [Clostridiales bacterium]